MASINPVSFTSPLSDTGPDIYEIQRRQALADALQKQSMQPLQTNRMIGRVAIPISPWEGAAKLAQGASAAYMQDAASQKQRELVRQLQGDASKWYANGPQGQAVPTSQEGTGSFDMSGSAGPQQLPPTKQDQLQHLMTGLNNPYLAPIAQAQLKQMMEPEKYGHTPQIEMVNGVPHSVVYGDQGTRKVIGPVTPQNKFTTQTADSAARIAQADKQWQGLSAYQQKEIEMQAARLGISVQELMIQRANAANTGINTQFNTGNGVIPAMPQAPAIPQVPPAGVQPPQGAQPLPQQPQANPVPVVPQMTPPSAPRPAVPQTMPQPLTTPQPPRITPKQRTELEVKRPHEQAAVKGVLSQLDNSLFQVDKLLTSPGLSNITGTVMGRTPNITQDAVNSQSYLDTLKAQVGVHTLQAMREASKTGGAVGQVTEREWPILQNQLAALQQSQSTEEFKANLGVLKASLENLKKNAREAYEGNYGKLEYAPPPFRAGATATGLINQGDATPLNKSEQDELERLRKKHGRR